MSTPTEVEYSSGMSRLRRVSRFGLKLITSTVTLVLLVVAIIYLVRHIADGNSIVYSGLALWALLAYVALPKIHRFFTKIYIPSYYIGRTRTLDGFYGDPVNMAVIGSAKELHDAMKAAGWTKAEPVTLASSLKIIRTSLLKQSYTSAPVSPLFLFSNKQDFTYQQEVDGNPRVRHHIRFWKTPSNWWLPGGYEADWLAAATFDKSVGLSLYTGQVTHKIDSNTDEERDYVIRTLRAAKRVKSIKVIEHFTSAYHSRNGGGDHIKTDGSMPFVTLR